jgi:hypothetical protein
MTELRALEGRPLVPRQGSVKGVRLLLMSFLLCLPLVTPRIRGADEIEYFAYLHSAFFDHDLEFGNEYQYFYDHDPAGLAGFHETFLERREASTGRHINFGPMGTALLWAPFYLVVHVAVLFLSHQGFRLTPDGLSLPYQAAACYASVLYGFGGLLLLLRSVALYFSEKAALAATLTVFWATPLLYYMTLAPGFSHAASLFAVSLMVFLFVRLIGRASQLIDWVAVGAAGGLAGLVREQDALFLAIPLGHLAWDALRTRAFGRAMARITCVVVPAFLVFLPQRFVYHALNGTFSPSPLVRRKLSLWSPHFVEVLWNPAHGLFLWCPLLLLAVFGLLFMAFRQRRELGLLFLGAFLLQAWINGCLESWTQAGAFGSRRFLSATPLFAFGFATLFDMLLPTVGTWALGAFLALGVWWNVSLMVQFGLKLMDRQGLEWPRVATNQFLEVPPRLGRVARLFFTHRERLVHEGS